MSLAGGKSIVACDLERVLWSIASLVLEITSYRKVASSRQSRLVAHLRIFRLFMKGKVDAYVL